LLFANKRQLQVQKNFLKFGLVFFEKIPKNGVRNVDMAYKKLEKCEIFKYVFF
jgi:hypothetical protein